MRASTIAHARLAGAALVALALVGTAGEAGAQRTTRTRRTQPIEIRGQVPTPQVVTVRPREVPQYNRRFLVPNFYDHDFWPVILPGYQLVSTRLLAGNARLDSLVASGADSARLADSTRLAAFGRAAIGARLLQPVSPPPRPLTPTTGTPTTGTPTTGTPAMPADTTRRTAVPADSTRRP